MKPVAIVLKLLTDRMPRKVAIASLTMGIALVVFGVLFFVLGGAHDDVIALNSNLKKTLDQTTKKAKQSRDDRQFIIDNQAKYEELLHGDRLVPHTVRVAMEQLVNLGKQDGLDALSYNFTTAADRLTGGTSVQTVQGGYKLQVQKVDLKVGAPLDTQLYDFLLDLSEDFPGSAVVEQFSFERSSDITTDALNQVSRNHEAGLVKGEIYLTWRTAQAQEDDKKTDAGKSKDRK